MSQSLDLLKLLTKDYSMGSSHKLKRKRKRWSWRKRGYYMQWPPQWTWWPYPPCHLKFSLKKIKMKSTVSHSFCKCHCSKWISYSCKEWQQYLENIFLRSKNNWGDNIPRYRSSKQAKLASILLCGTWTKLVYFRFISAGFSRHKIHRLR